MFNFFEQHNLGLLYLSTTCNIHALGWSCITHNVNLTFALLSIITSTSQKPKSIHKFLTVQNDTFQSCFVKGLHQLRKDITHWISNEGFNLCALLLYHYTTENLLVSNAITGWECTMLNKLIEYQKQNKSAVNWLIVYS